MRINRSLINCALKGVLIVVLALLFFAIGEEAGYKRGHFEGRMQRPNKER